MRKYKFVIAVLFVATAFSVMGMSRAPEVKNTDAGKALAAINHDNSVGVTKAATEMPPVSATIEGSNNNVTLGVPPNSLKASVSTTTTTEADTTTEASVGRQSAYTLGQKLWMFAIGVMAILVLIGVVVWWFKRQFPAISVAIDGMVSEADSYAAKKIQELRVKMAAARTADEKQAYAEGIQALESTRGVTATQRGKMDV